MRRRRKSPSSGRRVVTIGWVAVDGPETHSLDAGMSDTLVHFLNPLLSGDAVADPRICEGLVEFGVEVWNLGASMMPEWKNQLRTTPDPRAELRKMAKQRGATQMFLEMGEALLNRRRTIFSEDVRFVVEFDLEHKPKGGYHLTCLWTWPVH